MENESSAATLRTKVWKANNKQAVLEQKKRRQLRNAEWIYQYKLTHPCNRCGEAHPGCIQFHHTDPKTKRGDIAQDYMDWGIKRIEREIAKCEVLCANCHTKHHWLERNPHRG